MVKYCPAAIPDADTFQVGYCLCVIFHIAVRQFKYGITVAVCKMMLMPISVYGRETVRSPGFTVEFSVRHLVPCFHIVDFHNRSDIARDVFTPVEHEYDLDMSICSKG